MRLFFKEIIIPYHVTFSWIEQADFVASPVSSDIQVPMHDGRKHGIQNTGFILLHIQFFPLTKMIKLMGCFQVGMIILRNHLVFGSWKQGLSQT